MRLSFAQPIDAACCQDLRSPTATSLAKRARARWPTRWRHSARHSYFASQPNRQPKVRLAAISKSQHRRRPSRRRNRQPARCRPSLFPSPRDNRSRRNCCYLVPSESRGQFPPRWRAEFLARLQRRQYSHLRRERRFRNSRLPPRIAFRDYPRHPSAKRKR